MLGVLVVFGSGEFYKFCACWHIYGRELWIERCPNRVICVCEHLRQWYSISKIMVPSSFKLTIVAIVGPKEYCTRRRRVPHHPSPTCSRSWSFTVCSASYIKRTRPHPYHVQKVQGFEPADCPRCVIYCKWLLPQCRERPNFLQCILFTHEAGFARNAVLYSDNTHIWSDSK